MALIMGLHQNALHDARKEMWPSTAAWDGGRFRTFREAPTKEQEPVIPAPHIFQSLLDPPKSDPNGEADTVPTVAECAAHLELLEAFHALKAKIIGSQELDSVLGIVPRPKTVYRTTYGGPYRSRGEIEAVKIKDTTFAARRREKWPFFLRLAVVRFMAWLQKADLALKEAPPDSSAGATTKILSAVLPPLDVLLVWHSFLLNPLDYQEYCKACGLERIRQASFPWTTIHKSINPLDWSFTLPVKPQSLPMDATCLVADLFEYLVNIREKSAIIAETLVTYGAGNSMEWSVDLRPSYTDHLAWEEVVFVRTLNASAKDTAINRSLFEAVQRQEAFVKKMHAQLWIRSPALEGTLQRAINRYLNFVKLFKLYHKTVLVPTLDIDLVWHTHQCSPAQYQASMIQRTGRFINHDDKIGQPVLAGRMETTKNLFRVRFGQEYLVCHCWDCEAALSAVSASKQEGKHRTDMSSITSEILEDVAYYRAVELARQAGKPLPMRNG